MRMKKIFNRDVHSILNRHVDKCKCQLQTIKKCIRERAHDE